MKQKKLLCVLLTLLLAASLALPALGAESPEPEGPAAPEEETVPPEETPDPDVPDGTEEPPAPEEIPSGPEIPDQEEIPGEEEPPADPELPGEAEVPGTEEEPPAQEEVQDEPEAPEEEEGPAEEEPADEEEAAEPETLHVVLPSSAWVVVNPYGLEVSRDGISSRDQIVSAPMPIVNYSSVPVAVIASVTGYTSPGSDVVFTSAPPWSDSWAKELFLFAEFQPAFDEYGGAYWSGQYTGAANQLIVTVEGSPAAQVLELAAGDVVPGCGALRLFGSAAVSPDDPWCAEDAIQVAIAFTFLPLA